MWTSTCFIFFLLFVQSWSYRTDEVPNSQRNVAECSFSHRCDQLCLIDQTTGHPFCDCIVGYVLSSEDFRTCHKNLPDDTHPETSLNVVGNQQVNDQPQPEITESICNTELNPCDHWCEMDEDGGGVLCTCDENFDLIVVNGQGKCIPKCKDGQVYDSNRDSCIPSLLACKLDPRFKEYSNLPMIGQGYNMMKGDPFAQGVDPGFQTAIFSPYAQYGIDGYCMEAHGYTMEEAGYAKSDVEVHKVRDVATFLDAIEDIVDEQDLTQESELHVQHVHQIERRNDATSTGNHQVTTINGEGRSVNNGWSQGSSHGERRGNDQSTDVGSTSSSENCDTRTRSFSLGSSQSRESASSNSVSSGTSNTQASERGWNTNVEVGASVSAGFNVGFASGSATMSTTLSSGEHGSNSNSITNSQESSSSTSNVFGSSNNQQSSTGNENRKCETMGLTNSRATRLSLDINREHQNARSGGRSYDYRVDLSRLLGASYTSSRGDSLQKGQTLNTVVKGFSQSFMASDTFKDTLKFFMETEGSLMMGTTHTRIYGAKMEMNKPPAFTDNFKSELQLMHTATMVMGHLDQVDGNITAKFDMLFRRFIKTFGTHYLTKVSMGSRQSVISRFTKQELSRTSESEVKSCVEQKMGKGPRGGGSNRCQQPFSERMWVGNEEVSRVTKVSYGSVRLCDTAEECTAIKTENPVPVKVVLKPVTTMFNPQLMSVERVASFDGKPIAPFAILKWFLPRFEDICSTMGKFRKHPKTKPIGSAALVDLRTGSHNLEPPVENGDVCQAGRGCSWFNRCRDGVEKCLDDNSQPNGYRCEFVGCPKPGDIGRDRLCPQRGTMCLDDRTSRKGYKCVPSCIGENLPGSTGRVSVCRPGIEKCVPSNTEASGYTCQFTGCPSNKNICPKGSKCQADSTLLEGYRCIESCSDRPCRPNIETCISHTSKPAGFECKYEGCPKEEDWSNSRLCGRDQVCINSPTTRAGFYCADACSNKHANCREHVDKCIKTPGVGRGFKCEFVGCPKNDPCPVGLKCQADIGLIKGYKCIDPCNSGRRNPCREVVEECKPTRDNAQGYTCTYIGCPRNDRVCGPGKKCLESPDSRHGYFCVDACYKNDCREHVEKCVEDRSSPKGYQCQYKGCPAGGQSICPSGSICQNDPNSSKGYKCNNICGSPDPCLKSKPKSYKCVLAPSQPNGYECRYRGCQSGNIVCQGQEQCVTDPYSVTGYECKVGCPTNWRSLGICPDGFSCRTDLRLSKTYRCVPPKIVVPQRPPAPSQPGCPSKGCPKDQLVAVSTFMTNKICFIKGECDRIWSIDGGPNDGSECHPSRTKVPENVFCCRDHSATSTFRKC